MFDIPAALSRQIWAGGVIFFLSSTENYYKLDAFHNVLQMESKILCKDQYYICIFFVNFSGNQLDGIVIHDEEMLARWNKAYPNGYDLVKGLTLHSRLTP